MSLPSQLVFTPVRCVACPCQSNFVDRVVPHSLQRINRTAQEAVLSGRFRLSVTLRHSVVGSSLSDMDRIACGHDGTQQRGLGVGATNVHETGPIREIREVWGRVVPCRGPPA